MQVWIDAFEEKWRAPDANHPMLIVTETLMSMEWPKKVNASCELGAVILEMVKRDNPKWHEWYYGPMGAEEKSRQAARLSALENEMAAKLNAKLKPAPAMPVLSHDSVAVKFQRQKCWGCSHNVMTESKAVKFRPLMNLDLLPFDGGIGCGQFHNHGTCDCGGAKSHKCPLLGCGLIHAFKKMHVNLD